MLLELEIKGFALVEHLVLEFESGLTVLTGETGAGKSIILDSVTFLLGGSAPKESESCRVAGRFQLGSEGLACLEEQGLEAAEEILILRERKESGRTSSRLNGSLVSVGQLKALSEHLVDFHGQHQSFGLTRPRTHLPFLDEIASSAHRKKLGQYRQRFQAYRQLCSRLEETQMAERERLRQIEWLSLEVEDIEEVAPRAGESVELESEIKRLGAAEDLLKGGAACRNILADEGGVLGMLAQADGHLKAIASFDPKLAECQERLVQVEVELRDLWSFFRDYTETQEHEPDKLDKLVRRAESIKKLCRKFGPTVEDVLRHLKESQEKLGRLQNSEALAERLTAEKVELEEELSRLSQALTKGRRKAAAELGKEMVAELSKLAMPEVVFEVEFEEREAFGPNGKDRAQFLFSPNPGRSPKPLAETGSGGELSRVMLALVSVLSRSKPQPTLIFDEIDAGLGGRTAEAVAQKLKRLAQEMQVVCVTHLPVVAAAGQGHLRVEKSTTAKNTEVRVQVMEGQDRVDELARMLSGDSSQAEAGVLAKKLLAKS